MIHEFQPRPLPDASDYTNAVQAVEKDIEATGLDPEIYFSKYGLNIASIIEFSKSATQLANAIEPVDKETGLRIDFDRRLGRSLYLGAKAGYAILRHIYGVSLPAPMLKYVPPFKVDLTSNDPSTKTNNIHAAVLNMGAEGSNIYGDGAFYQLVKWSERAVSRPEYRSTFIAGSGIIALAGVNMQKQRIEQFQIDQLHEHVDSNRTFDWDSALEKLNSGGL
ncbi:MAG: hypothetical protein WAR37_00165 [Candidatus Microsaccharimonas sp.]